MGADVGDRLIEELHGYLLDRGPADKQALLERMRSVLDKHAPLGGHRQVPSFFFLLLCMLSHSQMCPELLQVGLCLGCQSGTVETLILRLCVLLCNNMLTFPQDNKVRQMAEERKALLVIFENKIQVLASAVASSVGALLQSGRLDRSLDLELLRDVSALRNLAGASVAALKRASFAD